MYQIFFLGKFECKYKTIWVAAMKEYSIYTEYNVHQRAMNLKGSRNIAFGNMMEKAQLRVSVRMLCLVKITNIRQADFYN